jgi:hypothetical protein
VAHPVAFFEANPAAGVDELQSDHAGAFYSLSSTPLPAMWPLAATVVIVIPCVFAVVAVSFARHGKAIEPLDMLAFSVYLFLGETCSNIWYSCGFKIGLAAVPTGFSVLPIPRLFSGIIESSFATSPDREMVGMVLVAQKLPPPARGQTRAELKLMHHRGIAFFNAEDQRICCDPHWMPAFLVQLAADATADAMVMRLLTATADSVTLSSGKCQLCEFKLPMRLLTRCKLPMRLLMRLLLRLLKATADSAALSSG